MLLEVSNLSIKFNSLPNPTVQNVSFSLVQGKTLAIVGESGSGKSITALSLLGFNNNVTYPTGEVVFDSKSLLGNLNWQNIRGREITFVFQEPMTALNPLHSIFKQLSEIIRLHNPKINKSECLLRLHELLDDVELSYLKNRLSDYPHQLSGGERQRLMIAMAIANHPKLLIADEPTTALDVSTQAKIIALLQKLQQKHGMSLLLITHDLHLVKNIADEVIVMRGGEVVESAATAQIFAQPKHDYTKILLANHHSNPPVSLPNDAKIILECDGLQISYMVKTGFFATKKPKIALKPSDFSLRQGETLGVVGESGSGKTSLGLAVARLISSSGSIVFQGQELNNMQIKHLRQMRAKLQFVFQDPFSSLNPRMNIEQIITEGLNVHLCELSKAQKLMRLDEILAAVGLPLDSKNRYPHEFSGGQRQRINIARAMILRPDLVIFDEPTSALDITMQTQIIQMLKDLQQQYQTSYVFISHDIRSIQSISHQLIVLQNGEIIEHGTAHQVLSQPKHAYTKMLIEAAGY